MALSAGIPSQFLCRLRGGDSRSTCGLRSPVRFPCDLNRRNQACVRFSAASGWIPIYLNCPLFTLSDEFLSLKGKTSSFWSLLHISPVRNASGKIAFYVSVHMDENTKSNGLGLSPQMTQLGVVGAVKVAVRSLSLCAAPSRSSS